MKHMFIGLLFFSSAAFSNQNFTEEIGWIDRYQRYFSKKVHAFAYHLDEKLTSYNDDLSENNTTSQPSDVSGWFSGFFRDEIFDEEYTKSYVIMRNTLRYDHQKGDYMPTVTFKASLVLPLMENRLHLFIDSESDDTDLRNYNQQEEGSIGLRYNMMGGKYLDASYSIGMHGLDDPYM